ncbi:MAG: hypothetical protein ACOCQQ_02585 [Candidatus Nanoarchaeia archaeon]
MSNVLQFLFVAETATRKQIEEYFNKKNLREKIKRLEKSGYIYKVGSLHPNGQTTTNKIYALTKESYKVFGTNKKVDITKNLLEKNMIKFYAIQNNNLSVHDNNVIVDENFLQINGLKFWFGESLQKIHYIFENMLSFEKMEDETRYEHKLFLFNDVLKSCEDYLKIWFNLLTSTKEKDGWFKYIMSKNLEEGLREKLLEQQTELSETNKVFFWGQPMNIKVAPFEKNFFCEPL